MDDDEKSSESKSARSENKTEGSDSRGKGKMIFDASGMPYHGDQDPHRSKHGEKRARKGDRGEEREKPAILDLRESLSQRDADAARGDSRKGRGSETPADSGKEEDSSSSKRRKKDDGDGHIPVSQRLGPLRQR